MGHIQTGYFAAKPHAASAQIHLNAPQLTYCKQAKSEPVRWQIQWITNRLNTEPIYQLLKVVGAAETQTLAVTCFIEWKSGLAKGRDAAWQFVDARIQQPNEFNVNGYICYLEIINLAGQQNLEYDMTPLQKYFQFLEVLQFCFLFKKGFLNFSCINLLQWHWMQCNFPSFNYNLGIKNKTLTMM